MTARRSRSRKRSAASSTSTPREPLTFFTDECLGKRVPAALRAAGADVRVHAEHFAQGTPDADWLRALRDHRWVVLTKDKNMRRRPLEIAALMEASLRVFAVTAGDVTGEELSRLLVAALPRINRVAYSLWKTLCVRAPLRAVFAYRPDWESGIQLV